MTKLLLTEGSDPRVLDLAKKVEEDIRERRLRPGDSYLTTAQCARILAVSTAAANRALQLLSIRGVLKRTRRAGTIVTEPSTEGSSILGKVTVLVEPIGVGAAFHGLRDEVLLGLQSAFARAETEMRVLPQPGQNTFVKKLLRNAQKQHFLEGFILVSVSADVQRLFLSSGLPCILQGHPRPSVERLSFLDRDCFECGYQLAHHLLAKGSRQLLVLLREEWPPGDHLFIDGVLAAAERLPPDAVRLCGMETDELSVRAEVEEFLGRSTKSSAILALTGELALFVHQALRAHARGRNAFLGIADCGFEHAIIRQYSHLRYTWSYREVGMAAGRLLERVAAKTARPGENLVIPTHLVGADVG